MKTTLRYLRRSLPNYRAEWARAARRHPALSLANPEAALRALRSDSPLSHDQRDAILHALVLEKQATSHSLWPALLLLAFEPAMRKLRRRAAKSCLRDLDAIVLAALLEAAGTVRTHEGSMMVRLHRKAARKVLKQARDKREQDEVEFVPLDERRLPHIPAHRDQLALTHCAASEVIQACESTPGGVEMALFRIGATHRHLGADGKAMTPGEQLTRNRLYQDRHRALGQVRRALQAEPDGE